MTESDRLFELSIRLAREADDHVGRHADGPLRVLDPLRFLQILLAGIFTQHRAKDLRRPTLHWQMHVVTECRDGLDRMDNVGAEVARMGRGEANPTNPGNFPDSSEQLCKGPF